LLRGAEAAPPARGFRAALIEGSTDRLAVIAEVKKRSPSKGPLNPTLNVSKLTAEYASHGASCLSVLTDGDFFGGSASDLMEARHATALPVLRKDFTVNAKDVCDARIMGADAVLLIAAALDDAELKELAALARYLEIDALIETHDEDEVKRALDLAEPDLIGVNQRDLHSFHVDQERAVRVAEFIPSEVFKVAESGVDSPEAAAALAQAGFGAVLVGEHLVTAEDPGATLESLRIPLA
jgi:indole-3-glycerol phosphate synthase